MRMGAAMVVLAAVGLMGPYSWSHAPTPRPRQGLETRESRKSKQKSQRALERELDSAYKGVLNEIRMILSDEELAAFLRLNTNEEREQFIETVWEVRDPNPDTVENEFKEEHYRRIAYANERFSSGIPGWKTDRGLIYIMHGPPDETESHPGGAYTRSYEEGGGQTAVYPFERWRYRNIPGLGSNIVLEFVDRSQSGEFRLEIDPSKKDALTHIPGAGLSELESMNLASKTDRFQRGDGTNLPRTLGGLPESMNPFTRLTQYALIFRPPPVKAGKRRELVDARLVRSQVQFTHRFDFIRITEDAVLVPITIQVPNAEMTFRTSGGVHSGVLNVYGRISTVAGRVVQTFEEDVKRDLPESLLEASLRGSSIYQKSIPLAPGLYRLDLVIKDLHSGDVGVLSTALRVSRFDSGTLSASSLILADLIEPLPARHIGAGQFVLGASKVRPRMDQTFSRDDAMGIWLQVYDLALDKESRKSSVTVEYRLFLDGREIRKFSDTGAQLGQNGAQMTIEKLLSLSFLPQGKYSLQVTVHDHIAGLSVERQADFTVRSGDQKQRTTERYPQ